MTISALSACIAVDRSVTDTAKSCGEFVEGGTVDANLNIDASVKTFMQAAADFGKISVDLRGSVKTACANIAKDLGAADSWSVLGDSDDAIANGSGTGACDVANARIAAVMQANASANFALEVTQGACHPDFAAQQACDAQCKAQATCDSGTVETRCDPAALSVVCEGSCNVNAYCVGSEQVAANCMGQCESTCEGECKGTCISPDGTKTDNDPNCHGKCSSQCNGTCRGSCKVETDQGISCGADVSCLGGCSGSYTAPTCTTLFTPPMCMVDEGCLDACSAEVAKNAVCDPPHIELLANVQASADVQVLVKTLDANLPALIDAHEGHGKIVFDAAERLSSTGQDVLANATHLDAKSLACAGASVEATASAAAKLEVTVKASGAVAETCRSHAQ